MSVDIIRSVQKMYDEAGGYFSKTRNRRYSTHGSLNWAVTDKYLNTLKKGQSVLDVGCGNGRLVSGLPEGVEYLGFDFSRTLLSAANEKYPEQKFVYGDLVKPDVWRKLSKYDAIFAVAVLHHIPTREQQLLALKRMRTVCRKNGLLFLTVWNLWQDRFAQNHLDSLELKKVNPRWVSVPFKEVKEARVVEWSRFCVQMDIPYLLDLLSLAGWDAKEIFYADRQGREASMLEGENLVVVANNKM